MVPPAVPVHQSRRSAERGCPRSQVRMQASLAQEYLSRPFPAPLYRWSVKRQSSSRKPFQEDDGDSWFVQKVVAITKLERLLRLSGLKDGLCHIRSEQVLRKNKSRCMKTSASIPRYLRLSGGDGSLVRCSRCVGFTYADTAQPDSRGRRLSHHPSWMYLAAPCCRQPLPKDACSLTSV